MYRSLRLLLMTGATLLLAACATPRYETVTRYEPPADAAGAACLRGCQAALDACRGDCQAAWQACAAGLEPQVDERYAQALKAYADELRLYRRELDRYEWDVWLGWGHGYSGLWYSPWSYYPWPGNIPSPVSPGDPPTKEAVRDSLRKGQCKDDCGCQPRYEACYQGCGGRVVTETRCVANCPAGK